MDLFLLIFWGIIGTINMCVIKQINKVSYFVVWLIAMMHLLNNVIGA